MKENDKVVSVQDYMERTTFREPSVKVVDSMNGLVEAYSFSAPYHSMDEVVSNVKNFEKLDMPFNGMKSYIFQVTSSMFFRDLLFCVRPVAGIWARSQRTVPFDPENLFISGEYRNVDNLGVIHDSIRHTYVDLYERGVPLDDAKKHLSSAMSTQFTINLDDRTLLTFLRTLRLTSTELFDKYAPLFLNAIDRDMDYFTNRDGGNLLSSVSLSDKEFELLGHNHFYMDEMGENVMVLADVEYNLAAQFIRQHYSQVKYSIYNSAVQGDALSYSARTHGKSLVTVGVYATKDAFNKLISNRCTWFAQFDHEDRGSWSTIAGRFVEDMTPQEFFEFIRAKNGDDPYLKAQIARIDGVDLAPPSPFLLEFPWLVDMRKEQYGSDSIIFKKWEEMRDAGLINDNPDNEYRKKFQKVLDEKGEFWKLS